MKKSLILFLFPMLMGMFSCKKQNINLNRNAEDATAIEKEAFEPNVAMLNYLIQDVGFLPSTIRESKEGFVVGGDIFFTKKDFWEKYSIPENVSGRHYKWQYKTTVSNISVDLSLTSLPAAWKTAFRSAITAWNGLNRSVRFTEISGYCPANGITVQYASLGANYSNAFALGGFPLSNGYPCNLITVNSTFNGSLSIAEKTKTAVHELGHCIGIMHTDDVGGYALIQTATTSCNTGVDLASVFKQGAFPFVDFSSCDKAAIKAMYP